MSTDLGLLRDGFLLAMEAEGKSPRTIRAYGDSVKFFMEYAEAHGWPDRAEGISRQQVTAWLAHLQRKWRPATAANRYRGLLRFCNWLVGEGELEQSPMAGMKPPAIPRNQLRSRPRMISVVYSRPLRARPSRIGATRPS